MSDVIRFAKPKKIESPEVQAFKTDLKLFINFLKTINLDETKLSCIGMTTDPTTNNLLTQYLSGMIDFTVGLYEKAYNTQYSCLGLVDHGIFHSTAEYVHWSLDGGSPVFEFPVMTGHLDFWLTIFSYSEKKSIITNINIDGVNFFHQLASVLAYNINGAQDKGIALTGGAHSILDIEGSDINFGLYEYKFDRPEPLSELKIRGKMVEDDFIDYLSQRAFSDDYLIVPTDVRFYKVKHPKFTRDLRVVTGSVVLPAPNVIPLGRLDKELVFELWTASEIYELKYESTLLTWVVKLLGERTDIAFMNYIKDYLFGLDMNARVWETDGQSHWHKVPFTWKGVAGEIRWDRVVRNGTAISTMAIFDSPVDSATFQLETITFTTAFTAMLDTNTGLLSDVADGINDYIE